MEPHPKSQLKLRDKLREKLNHWTLWRAAEEVIPEVNRLLKGWGGYFHYANSTRVFDRLNQYAATGCNAGCGASGDARPPGGGRTSGEFSQNGMACIGCPPGRHGNGPWRRSNASE